MSLSKKLFIASLAVLAANAYGDIAINGGEAVKGDVTITGPDVKYVEIKTASSTVTNNSFISNDLNKTEDGVPNRGNAVSIAQGLSAGNVENNGLIRGYSTEGNASGNGISSTASATGKTNIRIGLVNNKGIILGKSELAASAQGTGNGISSYSGTSSTDNKEQVAIIKTVTNEGIISGEVTLNNNTTNASGNGISAYTRNTNIEDVDNNGIIRGKSIGTGQSSNGTGNGVSSYSNFGDLEDASKIGKITNQGIIDGYSSGAYRYAHGNGISNFFEGSTTSSSRDISIGNIENTGLIRGNADTITANAARGTGNGISSFNNGTHDTASRKSSIGNIENRGVIQGTIFDKSTGNSSHGNGNGILNYSLKDESETGAIDNIGIIRGFAKTGGTYNFSGNGIAIKGDISSTIANKGLIAGNQSAIQANKISGTIKNYGVMAGQDILKLNEGETTENYINYGIEVILDADGNILEVKTAENSGYLSEIGKTVINIGAENSLEASYENSIINGVGVDQGTLSLNDGENLDLKGSIVNAFKTAVTLQGNSSLTATDTIFNGGGLQGTDAVISGDEGNNEITLTGASAVNGSINLGAGDDKLSLSNGAIINGNIDGGDGIDSLTLGDGTKGELNIFHEIKSFDAINTKGNITLFETAKIDSGNITLENGNLTVRIDPSILQDGKIIGHALYDHKGNIESKDGKLVIGLNGLGQDSVVVMNGTVIDKDMDSVMKKDDKLVTNSLILDAVLREDGDIDIIVKKDLSSVIEGISYEKLDKIYSSIYTAGQLGTLQNTTLIGNSQTEELNSAGTGEGKSVEESIAGLLDILGQIYLNNPYAYSLKLSRDSMKLFENNLSYMNIRPSANEWIVQGNGLYSHMNYTKEDSGKNYYGVDTGSFKNGTTTNIGGGIGSLEYGLDDTSSIGFAIGGGHQKSNFKGSNDLEGNSLYLGIYGKKEIDSFKFFTGLGYQYSSMDVTRVTSNQYDIFVTGDEYNTNSFNAFAEAKYVIEGHDDWTIEPKVKLSYYYVSQDKIDEKYDPENLAITVKEASSNTADLEVGLDLVKTLEVENGTVKTTLSASIIGTVGNRSKNLTGKVKGLENDGDEFEIKGAEIADITGKGGVNVEYERSSGLIYQGGLNAEFGENYYRDIVANIGIGYKF